MKKWQMFLAVWAVGLTALAWAGGEKSPVIAQNHSKLSAELVGVVAQTAIAMGVAEPLVIKEGQQKVLISGSNATVCNIGLSGDAEPKILGVSCK